ncbi:MAG: copper-binding protein [Rubrivivax sp.]
MNIARVIAAVGVALAFGAQAQTAATQEHASHHAQASAPTSENMADGEVRKVDKEQGKVTLKHGPIASLDMPGMTMVFKVADPKLLGNLKQGDKVKFTADRINGAITVTAIVLSK